MSYRKKHIGPKIRGLRKRKKLFSMPLFWIGLVVFVLVCAFCYFVFFFPLFQVKHLEISGNIKVKSGEIESVMRQTMAASLLQKNIFTLDTTKEVAALVKAFPVITSVVVKKRFPDGIIVHIQERQAAAIFCDQATLSCFDIDSSGIIFEPAVATGNNLITVRSDAGNDTFMGERAVDAKIMDIILKVDESLRNNFQVSIREVLVSNPLIFTTSEHWKAYIDSNQDSNMQIQKMDTLLKDKISEAARKKLEYIYLQYQDRAYYK